MADLTQLKIQVSAAVIKKLNGKKTKINQEVAKELKEHNLLMLNRGIDTRGKRIRSLRPDYNKRKKSSKERNKMIRSGRDSKTEYAAKKSPNYGRLSGTTFSALKFKVSFASGKQTKSSVTLNVQASGGKRTKYWTWLEKNYGATKGWFGKGRKKTYKKAQRFYYGVVETGAYRKQLDKKIKAIILKYAR